jgi:phosphatidylserine decarboxylase
MVHWLATNLLWSKGRSIFLFLLLLGGLAVVLIPWLLVVWVPLFVFVIWFFRNPQRSCLDSCNGIIAPSDGVVVSVATDKQGSCTVAVFLSVFDVHVNWIPVDGVIESICYVPGKFLPAYRPKCSEENEHNVLVIKTPDNKIVRVKQIAGIIARRIVCWVSVGDSVAQGSKFGMIRFGSRVEITLDASAIVTVTVGQRVFGGQTVVARWRK